MRHHAIGEYKHQRLFIIVRQSAIVHDGLENEMSELVDELVDGQEGGE